MCCYHQSGSVMRFMQKVVLIGTHTSYRRHNHNALNRECGFQMYETCKHHVYIHLSHDLDITGLFSSWNLHTPTEDMALIFSAQLGCGCQVQ